MTHHTPESTTRSSDSGIALVIVMFMTLVLSVMASSLMFVARTETVSSFSYKTLSQARYAAESGLHSAANHLLYTYQPPGTTGAAIADPIVAYTMTGPTVTAGGTTVLLSSDPDVPSSYPIGPVAQAFALATRGDLAITVGTASYSARARLLSMHQILDVFDPVGGPKVTLQTWEITGVGRSGGADGAEVEVSAIIERQDSPLFKYAAFATDPGCDALRFGGGAAVDSYDSSAYSGVGIPVVSPSGGNVGSNGNMTGLGTTTVVNGSLSTPRSGVGNCTASNVTALSTNGATVTGGILELSQAVVYPPPPEISPLPPTGNVDFNGGCAGGTSTFCAETMVAGTPTITINPSLTGGIVTMADVRVQAGTNVHLKSGTYVINSISFSGNARITVDSPGEVIIKVAGQGVNTPIDFSGGAITNNSYDPSTLQFLYSGTGNVKMTGGATSAALVYAPNASASLTGGSDFYGAIVADEITDMGGARIHYDRKLQNMVIVPGNPMMGSFTWKTDQF
jgi:Tfp pilus assembly protein PilX